MRQRWYVVPVAAASAVVLATAGPASAVVSVSGSIVTSDAAGDNFSVYCSGGVLAATGSATTGSPCLTLTGLTVSLNAGSDTVDLSGVTPATFPQLRGTIVNADDGSADTITGSPFSDEVDASSTDTVNAGDGADRLFGGGAVNGGNGDDSFFDTGTGPINGGGGDDRFFGSLASNGIDGDEGVDTWFFDFDELLPPAGSDTTWTMTASGLQLAVGGVPAFDFAVTDMERVYLTLLQDQSQVYDGTAFPGSSVIWGLSGVDDLRGGSADDELFGGSGNDTLTGNGGSDRLHAGDGDDTVQARDGLSDRVDCGAGNDTVVADPTDVTTGCESVQLPAVPPPAAPQTGKVKGPDSVTKPAKAKFTFASPTAGASFQCKLDRKKWKACTSPHKVKTKKLDPGKHKLQVRAVLNGVVDATPSKKKFKVKRG